MKMLILFADHLLERVRTSLLLVDQGEQASHFLSSTENFSIKNSARLLLYTLLYLVFHWLPCLPTHRQHRLQNPKHECLVSGESFYLR